MNVSKGLKYLIGVEGRSSVLQLSYGVKYPAIGALAGALTNEINGFGVPTLEDRVGSLEKPGLVSNRFGGIKGSNYTRRNPKQIGGSYNGSFYDAGNKKHKSRK